MNEELLNQYYARILEAFPGADPEQLKAALQEYMSQVPPEQMQKDVDNLLAGQAITQETPPKEQPDMPVPPLHGQKPIPEGPEGQVIPPSPPLQTQGHTQMRMPREHVISPDAMAPEATSQNIANVTQSTRKFATAKKSAAQIASELWARHQREKKAQYYDSPVMIQAPPPVHHQTMDRGMGIGAGLGGLAGLLFPKLGTGRKKRILLAALGAAGGATLGGLLGAGGGLAVERLKAV